MCGSMHISGEPPQWNGTRCDVNACIHAQGNKLAIQVICDMTGFLRCHNQGREWRARARLHLRANTRTGMATMLQPAARYLTLLPLYLSGVNERSE
jgi:hypothetical protein